MSKIVMPIDTKSFHYNIKNDNKKGHTATVATPLRQGNTFKTDLGQIFDIPESVPFEESPDLINEILKNTRTKIKILKVYVFDNISVNNMPIDIDKQFCIYIREEVDPDKAQCGRIKVHYPMSFNYSDTNLNIDNKSVVQAISKNLINYAFLVDAFEYDFETKTLNLRVTIVGENQIPYSKVFINEKGAGNKFTTILSDFADSYDMEIISLRAIINEGINPNNYVEIIEVNRKIAVNETIKYLKALGMDRIRYLYEDFPYSLYDFEYYDGENIKYVILNYTSTKTKYFNLSIKKVAFLNDFKDFADVFLITNINQNPTLHKYSFDNIQEFNKNINSIMYIEGGT